MNIMIIEDENLAIRRLNKLLEDTEENFEIAATTKSIAESVDWLQHNNPPDLILLDIELADGQSFDIFNRVTVKSPVIFTTSYDEYALKAFEVHSIDYLLKPIELPALKRALEKYKQLKAQYASLTAPIDISRLLDDLQSGKANKVYKQRFLVRYANKLLSVETADIAYFFLEGRETFFRTYDNKKFLVDYNLDEITETLESSAFFRINRTTVVAFKSIQQIDDYLGNRLVLKLSPTYDKETLVSRERVQPFKEWLGR